MRTAAPPPGPGGPRVRGRSAVEGAGRPNLDKRGRVRSYFFGFSGLPQTASGVEKVEVSAPPFFSCSLALLPFYSFRAYI
jgi:hypothetical protein